MGGYEIEWSFELDSTFRQKAEKTLARLASALDSKPLRISYEIARPHFYRTSPSYVTHTTVHFFTGLKAANLREANIKALDTISRINTEATQYSSTNLCSSGWTGTSSSDGLHVDIHPTNAPFSHIGIQGITYAEFWVRSLEGRAINEAWIASSEAEIKEELDTTEAAGDDYVEPVFHGNPPSDRFDLPVPIQLRKPT